MITTNFETEYVLLETDIKRQLETMVKQSPLDTILGSFSSKLNALVYKDFSDVYSLSLALLIDDIIDINFPEEFAKTQHGWYNYSYLDGGYIGHCCKEAQKQKTKVVFILKNKKEIAMAPHMTQKSLFLTHSELQSFCVVPVLIGEHIVGSLQLSFKTPLTDILAKRVETFLHLLAEKITWILYSEQVRLSGILEIAKTMIGALESKDNYQAHHSENVANLVNLFIFLISRHEEYKRLLFRSNKNVSGLSFIKLRLAALLHDMGKFSMANEIFDEKEPQKLEDKCKRRLHPFFSYYILNTSRLTRDIATTSAFHHERISGKGYPFGIAGRELSVEAQIISFADKFDSIARIRKSKSKRSSFENVIEVMQKIEGVFSDDVYLALSAIIKDYFDQPEKFPTLTPREAIIFKELLGIPIRKKRGPLQTKTELDQLFKFAKFSLSKIDLNQWWVMVLLWNEYEDKISIDGKKQEEDFFRLNVKIRKKKDGKWWEKNNWIWRMSMCRITNQPGLYIGIHKPEMYKERAYAFCEDLATRISPNCRMAAVFIDRIKSFENSSILDCRKQLIEAVRNMNSNDRWRLLMV
ncbi:MAG: HD domain-containing protein [Candidatus Aminicenantes bacterium]|nr:HD domain-containing protein [Candidatus Aminicenantes bacterium]